MRMPIGPYFGEPIGTDCYFNEIGYLVMGSITLAWAIPLGLVCFALGMQDCSRSARGGSSSHKGSDGSTKSNPALRWFYFLATISQVWLTILVILGYFAETQRYVLPLFIIWGFFFGWMFFFVTKLYKETIVKVIIQYRMKGDITEYFGGRVNYTIFRLVFAFCSLSFYGLLLTTSVLFGMDPYTYTGQIVFRTWCVLVAALTFVVFAAFYVLMGNFADIIEKSMAATVNNVERGADIENSLNEVIQRFRKSRLYFCLGAGTPAVGLWVLHCSVLPLFSYAFLFHMLNQCLVISGICVSVTSKSRIKRLLPKGLLSSNTSLHPTNHSSTAGQQVVHSVVGNLPEFGTTAIASNIAESRKKSVATTSMNNQP